MKLERQQHEISTIIDTLPSIRNTFVPFQHPCIKQHDSEFISTLIKAGGAHFHNPTTLNNHRALKDMSF